MNQKTSYSLMIKAEARRLGFDDCGISAVEFLKDDADYLLQWLEKGFHSGMHYMTKNVEKRINPAELVEGAKSVVSVILNYFPDEKQADPDAPVISKYAYGKDYHLVIRSKLNELLMYVKNLIPGTTGRAFVDSAPVLEHAWARRSGLGWIGKNSLLLTSRFGSFVFIGELIVSAEMEYDVPVKNQCGTCRKCIDACPTGAIVDERVIDSNKCISYHTIENKGEIDPSLKGSFENRVFGCDICQDVCPWNRKAIPTSIKEFNLLPEIKTMSKEQWYRLDQQRFNSLFKDSAVQRAGFTGIKRNLDFIRTNPEPQNLHL